MYRDNTSERWQNQPNLSFAAANLRKSCFRLKTQ